MPRSAPVDGFRLEYDRYGDGDPVVLLHGRPGARTGYDAVAPMLDPSATLVVPDLRGFGASDKHREPPAEAYTAAAQARSVLGLIDELRLDRPVLAGYDIGSRRRSTRSLCRSRCCGRSTIPCSRGSGRIGWASSSARWSCSRWTASATSPRSRPREPSPP